MTSRSANSVDLSWNSANATSWEVEYGATGFNQGNGTLVVMNSNPGTVTGLTSGSVYDFYIRSLCGGGDTSDWIGPVTSMPYCASVSAPFTENFDANPWQAGTGAYNAADSVAPCWWRNPQRGSQATDPVYWGVRSITGTTPNTGPDQDHSGGNFVYLESSAGSFNQIAALESPFIDLSPLTSPELRFYYHMFGNSMGTLRVDVYKGSSGTWTNGVWSISGQQHSSGSDPFTVGIVDLSAYAGDSVIIRFSGIKGNERRSDMAIDAMSIDEAPACPQPSLLVASNITTTSVDLSWTTGGATNWQIEYGVSGFTQGQGTIVNASTNPFTLPLGSSQVFDIYVRDSCGQGNVSAWTGPVTVTMPCGIATIPWSENFDGSNWTPGFGGTNNGNGISSCWSRPSFANPNFGTGNGGTPSAGTGPSADVSGNGNYLYTEASNGASGPGSITSPQIILSTSIANPTLKFYYHMYGTGIDSLYVEINNGSGWTYLWGIAGQQQTSNGAAWTLVQQSIQSYSGDTVQIRFTGVNNAFAADMAIDEVAIDDISCLQSSNFIASSLTSSAVTLSWTSAGAPGFIIEYGPVGFSPGSGTSLSSTSSPLTVTGLTSGTTYDFYLRDSCGATSFGQRLGPLEISTLCNPYTAPFTENFNDSSWVVGVTINNNLGNRINNCWTRPSDANPNFGPFTGQTPSAGTGPNDDVTGGGKYLYTEVSGTTGFGEISSPEIIIPSSFTSPAVKFDYFLFGGAIDSLSIYVNKAGSLSFINSIVGQQQNSLTDAWISTSEDLSAYSGDTIQVVFRGYSSGFQGDIAIDEFEVYDDPCPKPSNLSSTGATTNSITLSWTSGGATNWQIEYGPAGFNPGSGTIVAAATNPFTVTALSPSVYYDFYVQDSCGLGITSLWTGPELVSTLCDTAVAPYFENFDNGFNPGTNNATAQNIGSTISPCWTRDSDTNYFWGGGTGQTPTGGTGPFGDHTGGGNYVFVESSFAAGGSTAWIESPVVDLSSLNFPELRFWYQMWAQNGSQGDLFWEIDSGNGVWNSLGSLSGNQGFAWTEVVVDLRNYANKTVKVRFRAIKSSGATAQQGDIAIDDFSIIEGPSCPDPDSLNMVSRSMSSLNIAWRPASASDFNVSYQATSGGPLTIINTTNPSAFISGLAASTSYVVCVRDSCAAGDVSGWVCDTFQTLCAPLNLPFSENFDGANWTAGFGGQNAGNTIDNCWDRPLGAPFFGTGNGGTPSGGTGPSADFSGAGNYIYSEYSGTTEPYGAIYSPYFYFDPNFPNPELSFAYHMFGANIDSMVAYMEVNGNLSRIWGLSGAQQAANADPFLEARIDLRSFSGDTARILWRAYGSGFQADMAIDEVAIDSVSCPIPSQLSVSGITTSTASVSWTSTGSSAELSFGPSGFAVGTANSQISSGTTGSLAGLQPGSFYDVYVRAICGPGDTSAWQGPVSFFTLCGTYVAPYYESFDLGFDEGLGGLNTGATVSPCWTRNRDTLYFWGGGSGATPSIGTGPGGDHTSGSGNYVYTEGTGGAGGDTAVLQSGLIDMSALVNPELRFWLHMFSNAGTGLEFYWDIESNGTWTNLGSLSGDQGNTWIEQRSDLSLYLNQTVKFRFRAIKAGGGSVFHSDIAIDEMVVDEKIACNPYTMPFYEDFDGNAWAEGTGGTNNGDQIDPCWIRVPSAQMQWGTGTGTTPSANTGPASDLSGSGNYLYTEASRGAAQAIISTPPIIVDTLIAAPHIFYSYHMFGATITNLSIEIEYSGGPVLLRTHLGQQQINSTSAWISDSIDITAYQGDTITIKFIGDATSFTGDIAIDGIEVRDAILPCPDPINLSVSNIGQNDFSLSWNSSNGPNKSILTYYDLPSGPSAMQVITGLSSPYNLTGLLPNTAYVVYIYDSCSVGQFSTGGVSDTITTLPCDTVTANMIATNSYLGVSFDGNTSINADSLAWDYGDGNTGSGFLTNHVYATAGLYSITLYAFNDCGTGDTLQLNLQICDTLSAQIGATMSGFDLSFSANAQNASSYFWDFGDGTTDTIANGTHTYALGSTYTITLTVSNECGDSLTLSQTVQVCAPAKADWTYTVLSPVNSGLRIQFDGSASSNATSYSWDFGDGNTGSGVNPIHIYATPGLFYTVTLTVTNACGDQDSWAWALNSIGLLELLNNEEIKVYPNPFREVLLIERGVDAKEGGRLELFNGAGKLIRSFDLDREGLIRIQTSDLAPGLYQLRYRASDKSLRYWKLVKEN